MIEFILASIALGMSIFAALLHRKNLNLQIRLNQAEQSARDFEKISKDNEKRADTLQGKFDDYKPTLSLARQMVNILNYNGSEEGQQDIEKSE